MLSSKSRFYSSKSRIMDDSCDRLVVAPIGWGAMVDAADMEEGILADVVAAASL